MIQVLHLRLSWEHGCIMDTRNLGTPAFLQALRQKLFLVLWFAFARLLGSWFDEAAKVTGCVPCSGYDEQRIHDATGWCVQSDQDAQSFRGQSVFISSKSAQNVNGKRCISHCWKIKRWVVATWSIDVTWTAGHFRWYGLHIKARDDWWRCVQSEPGELMIHDPGNQNNVPNTKVIWTCQKALSESF